ncbi:helicase HerA-like domain-containing protein [Rhodococcus rhodochrous]|uniref:helicase HerA-like domain-containing protein n=1 Tax=Rhodococcus rhodochrous TaxID=1829 RepID=UPI00177B1984|nr:helicase HerA-like domain-containing protein [Rhodococcus rhodochrous]QOH56067.1 ATPase [Rhodococcus rhodochrous]
MTDKPENTAATIAAGYEVIGEALELGAVVLDGVADPEAPVRIPLATLDRHVLVAGATGTGKTKTLQVMAEQLSAAGVPVVMADMKSDLSGLSAAGEPDDAVITRAADTGDEDWTPTGHPVAFYSLGTDGVGIPVRVTVTSLGPLLLSKVLGLNATQESTLGLIFHWADRNGLPLLDLADLRQVIRHLASDEGRGAVSPATAGVILRAVVDLENAGGDGFFGEPELEVEDLLRVIDGQGTINLFEFGDEATRPALFLTFLMWLLADLFQSLPEVGDVDTPRLVFFFDEAHLLFTDASKAFLQQIEQTVKLIRSKGVGVVFCTRSPTDIPRSVLSQVGARIQHALRAFTPEDEAALAEVVRTFPKTDAYDLADALTGLGTGEAIVTVLSELGAPTPVAWTRLRPPHSLMGTVGESAMRASAQANPLYGKYGRTIDRESAYEKLTASVVEATDVEPVPDVPRQAPDDAGVSVVEQVLGSAAVRSFIRSAASAAGREIGRSLFGTGRRRRR